MSPKHAQPVATTRERILDAALDLFVDLGFAGTRIAQIEKAAGLAAGTGSFYRHFSSKDELLPVAVEREMTRALSAAQHEASAADLDDREQWLHRALIHLGHFDRLIRLLLVDGERVPQVRSAVEAVLGGMGDLISWEQQPEAVIGVAALHGYLLFSRAQGSPFYGVPPEEFIRVLATHISYSGS